MPNFVGFRENNRSFAKKLPLDFHRKHAKVCWDEIS
jgi:hypothetical protein